MRAIGIFAWMAAAGGTTLMPWHPSRMQFPRSIVMKRPSSAADTKLLRRIETLPVNAAHRARAAAEYRHAEAAADRLAGALARFADAIRALRRSAAYRQHRHG
jgi:hypothetical protein